MLPLTLLLAFLPGADPSKFADELAAIRAVGKEGAGNEAAAKAWTKLVAAGEPALIPTLSAFEGCNPAAQNWLRTAAYAIAEDAKTAGVEQTSGKLIGFLKLGHHHPSARRVAYELLLDRDAEAANAMLLDMFNDANLELRRDAIAARLAKLPKDEIAPLRTLFAAARDKDQVEAIAKLLKEKGSEPSISAHFGYITQWHVVGPFDNKAEKGYAVAYEPEKAVDLAAKYGETKMGWLTAQSSATYGTIDLNTAIGKHMNAVGYAVATINADADITGEIRVASQNAVKFYVNGAEVFAREEYHHGTKMDQHIAAIKLKKGSNIILLKVCQNDMTFAWAQAWGFAARICDTTGGSLPVKQSFNGETIELGKLAPAPAPKKD
jgi:hypothetical protein